MAYMIVLNNSIENFESFHVESVSPTHKVGLNLNVVTFPLIATKRIRALMNILDDNKLFYKLDVDSTG